METIESRKYNIIHQITTMNDELALVEIENFVKNLYYSLFFSSVAKPIKKEMSIQGLISEQNYRGVDRALFDQLVLDLDIQEPLDELIEMI